METKKKKRIIFIVLAAVIAACLAFGGIAYFKSSLPSTIRAVELLQAWLEKTPICAEVKVETEQFDFNGEVVRTSVDGNPVYKVEVSGVPFYYSKGLIYLENGKAINPGEFEELPDSDPLTAVLALYQKAEITETEEGEKKLYTITLSDEDALSLVQTILPEVSSVSDVEAVVCEENGLLSYVSLSESSFALMVTPKEASEADTTLPDAVLNAVSFGAEETAALNAQDYLTLIKAWKNMQEMEGVLADVKITEKGKVLELSQKVKFHAKDEYYAAEKWGLVFYFNENGICTASGTKLKEGEGTELSNTESMLGLLYLSVLNGDFSAEETAEGMIYTMAMSEEGMSEVMSVVTEEEGILSCNEGTLTVKVKENTITDVTAVMDVTLTVIGIEVPAEITIDADVSEETGFAIPDAVVETLKS